MQSESAHALREEIHRECKKLNLLPTNSSKALFFSLLPSSEVEESSHNLRKMEHTYCELRGLKYY